MDRTVLIVGGGPTGLMLAAELALAEIDVEILERRMDQEIVGARAGGLLARTLEVLDQRGIVDRFLAEGQVAQVTGFGQNRLDISDFPTRHSYGLGLWQKHIERLLADRVRELHVPMRYGCEVVGVTQDDDSVGVAFADGTARRAAYLVGCDGGRSTVRKSVGIEFPGWDATTSNLIAEIEVAEEPPLGVRRNALGNYGIGRIEYEIRDGKVVYADSGPVRVMWPEAKVGVDEAPTLDDVRAGLRELYGSDFGAHSPIAISRFTDAARQAASYRKGRVLLAGDAAHIHSPIGGQGLNTGVQDAVNLGWKLAHVVSGMSPDALLDTYHEERHPVGARVVRNAIAQVELTKPSERLDPLREVVAELLGTSEARKRVAGMMSGLDIRYDIGDGHPMLGRRMPDRDLETSEGPRRAYSFLHDARGVLLDFGAAKGLDASRWNDRVRTIVARSAGEWELPVIGVVPSPSAVLIRPDGYVAWVGDGTERGLLESLERWFGARE